MNTSSVLSGKATGRKKNNRRRYCPHGVCSLVSYTNTKQLIASLPVWSILPKQEADAEGVAGLLQETECKQGWELRRQRERNHAEPMSAGKKAAWQEACVWWAREGSGQQAQPALSNFAGHCRLLKPLVPDFKVSQARISWGCLFCSLWWCPEQCSASIWKRSKGRRKKGWKR